MKKGFFVRIIALLLVPVLLCSSSSSAAQPSSIPFVNANVHVTQSLFEHQAITAFLRTDFRPAYPGRYLRFSAILRKFGRQLTTDPFESSLRSVFVRTLVLTALHAALRHLIGPSISNPFSPHELMGLGESMSVVGAGIAAIMSLSRLFTHVPPGDPPRQIQVGVPIPNGDGTYRIRARVGPAPGVLPGDIQVELHTHPGTLADWDDPWPEIPEDHPKLEFKFVEATPAGELLYELPNWRPEYGKHEFKVKAYSRNFPAEPVWSVGRKNHQFETKPDLTQNSFFYLRTGSSRRIEQVTWVSLDTRLDAWDAQGWRVLPGRFAMDPTRLSEHETLWSIEVPRRITGVPQDYQYKCKVDYEDGGSDWMVDRDRETTGPDANGVANIGKMPIPQKIAELPDPLYRAADDLMSEQPALQELWGQMADELGLKHGATPRAVIRRVEYVHPLIKGTQAWTRIQILGQQIAKEYDKAFKYEDQQDPWVEHGKKLKKSVVYFSAEYGFQTVPIMGGGLGVLAGDHLRGANDLGLPFMGFGLRYKTGYLPQTIDRFGNQGENAWYVPPDIKDLPGQYVQVPDEFGAMTDLLVDIPLPGYAAPVKAKVWRVLYGETPLFLLDTDIEENDPRARQITSELYRDNSGSAQRMEQYAVLGIGGRKVIDAMVRAGLMEEPVISHLNDCHPVFAVVQAIADSMQDVGEAHADLNYEARFEAAFQLVKSKTVFTTHTPVGAGNEHVERGLMFSFLQHAFAASLHAAPHLSPEDRGKAAQYATERLLSLGGGDEKFNIAAFLLQASTRRNAVSELHGRVARGMWKRLFPGMPKRDVPIEGIVNAVNPIYWMSRNISELFASTFSKLGKLMTDPEGVLRQVQDSAWIADNVLVDNEALLNAHEEQRKMLLEEAQRRLRYRRDRSNWAKGEMELKGDSSAAHYFDQEAAAAQRDIEYLNGFDPHAFTIGFGRRFIDYKRAALIFSDMDRLRSIAATAGRPIQLFVAGKAHKKDVASQNIIRHVQWAAATLRSMGIDVKVILVENYDIELARVLESGPHIWLNNPRRFEEASGTSGMKAGMNGDINLGTRDGWNVQGIIDQSETKDGVINGWLIGVKAEDQSDLVDSEELYCALEDAIRDYEDKPTWARRMKASILSALAKFGTGRMLSQYIDQIYSPAIENVLSMDQAIKQAQQNLDKRKAILDQMRQGAGKDIQTLGYPPVLRAGDSCTLSVVVDLKGLSPDDIGVDLVAGKEGREWEWRWRAMDAVVPLGDGKYKFSTQVTLPPGEFKFKVRITPKDQTIWQSHDELAEVTYETGKSPHPIYVEDEDLLNYRVHRKEGRFFSLEIPREIAAKKVKRILWGSERTGWFDGDPLPMQNKDGFWTVWVDREKFSNVNGPYQFKFKVELENGESEFLTGAYAVPETADNPMRNAVIDLSQNDGGLADAFDNEGSRLFTLNIPFSIPTYKQRLIEGVYWISEDTHLHNGEPIERYRMDEIKPNVWAFLPPARFFKHKDYYEFKFMIKFKDGREKWVSGSYPIKKESYDNAFVSLSNTKTLPSADIAKWELQRLMATRTDQALRWIFDHPENLGVWLHDNIPIITREQVCARLGPQELELAMTAMAVMSPHSFRLFEAWAPDIYRTLKEMDPSSRALLLLQKLTAYTRTTVPGVDDYRYRELREWKEANLKEYFSYFPALREHMHAQLRQAVKTDSSMQEAMRYIAGPRPPQNPNGNRLNLEVPYRFYSDETSGVPPLLGQLPIPAGSNVHLFGTQDTKGAIGDYINQVPDPSIPNDPRRHIQENGHDTDLYAVPVVGHPKTWVVIHESERGTQGKKASMFNMTGLQPTPEAQRQIAQVQRDKLHLVLVGTTGHLAANNPLVVERPMLFKHRWDWDHLRPGKREIHDFTNGKAIDMMRDSNGTPTGFLVYMPLEDFMRIPGASHDFVWGELEFQGRRYAWYLLKHHETKGYGAIKDSVAFDFDSPGAREFFLSEMENVVRKADGLRLDLFDQLPWDFIEDLVRRVSRVPRPGRPPLQFIMETDKEPHELKSHWERLQEMLKCEDIQIGSFVFYNSNLRKAVQGSRWLNNGNLQAFIESHADMFATGAWMNFISNIDDPLGLSLLWGNVPLFVSFINLLLTLPGNPSLTLYDLLGFDWKGEKVFREYTKNRFHELVREWNQGNPDVTRQLLSLISKTNERVLRDGPQINPFLQDSWSKTLVAFTRQLADEMALAVSNIDDQAKSSTLHVRELPAGDQDASKERYFILHDVLSERLWFYTKSQLENLQQTLQPLETRLYIFKEVLNPSDLVKPLFDPLSPFQGLRAVVGGTQHVIPQHPPSEFQLITAA